MTHQNDYAVAQELVEKGLEGVPELMRVLINKVMQVERGKYLQAGEYGQLREIYSAQASALGMRWDSPEFKAYLFEQHKEYFPVEKLTRQIRDQAGDDDAEYNRLKAEIISEMYSTADIRIDFDALPEEAGNIHIPGLSEFPMIIAGGSEVNPTP